METFFKITKAQANLIGRFEYGKGLVFDPFCGEQVDGTYLVSVDLVGQLASNENILKVDWMQVNMIDKTELNNKVFEL